MSLNLKSAASAAVVYDIYRVNGLKAIYTGPKHSDLDKDVVTLTTQDPKASATYNGNRRSVVNVIDTITIPSPEANVSMTRDMKLDASASIPVGATLADFKELTARLAAFLSNDTYVEKFFMTGKIEL